MKSYRLKLYFALHIKEKKKGFPPKKKKKKKKKKRTKCDFSSGEVHMISEHISKLLAGGP